MSNNDGEQQIGLMVADPATRHGAPRKASSYPTWGTDAPPRLRLQVIERVAIGRLASSEFLLGEEAVRELIEQLDRLVEEEGHEPHSCSTSAGSGTSPAKSSSLLAHFRRGGGRRAVDVRLCGPDPLIRELLRVTRVDQLFDIAADEAEALGLLVR